MEGIIAWQEPSDLDGDRWPSDADLEFWHTLFLQGFAERIVYHSLKRQLADDND